MFGMADIVPRRFARLRGKARAHCYGERLAEGPDAAAGHQLPVLTGVITPRGVDADALRQLIHARFDLSLGAGLGKLKGR
jgi:hypothetical protein